MNPFNREVQQMLRYFNLEPSFKMRWCRAQDLFGSPFSVTLKEFELAYEVVTQPTRQFWCSFKNFFT